MSDDPSPSPVPPQQTNTLWYAHGGLRRIEVERFIRWLTFGRVVVLVLLALVAASVLWAIGTSIPHPYAGWGIDLFLLIATPAFFLFRRRAIVIGALAVVIGAAVVGLHLRAKRYVTIRNESAVAISRLEVDLEQGERCMEFATAGIPPKFELDVSMLFPGYDGGVLGISGEFADSRPISYNWLVRSRGRGSAGTYHNTTLVLIHPDGTVTVTNP